MMRRRLPASSSFVLAAARQYTELRCLAVAEAIEQRLGPLTPIDPVTG